MPRRRTTLRRRRCKKWGGGVKKESGKKKTQRNNSFITKAQAFTFLVLDHLILRGLPRYLQKYKKEKEYNRDETEAICNIYKSTLSPILRKKGLEKLLVALHYRPEDARKLGTAAQIYTLIQGLTGLSNTLIEDFLDDFSAPKNDADKHKYENPSVKKTSYLLVSFLARITEAAIQIKKKL